MRRTTGQTSLDDLEANPAGVRHRRGAAGQDLGHAHQRGDADAAFGQRRKTLRQALADWAGSPAEAERILIAAGISPQARGEELDVHQFVAIAKAKNA